MNTLVCSKNKISSQYNWSDFNPFTPSVAEAQTTKYIDNKPNVYEESVQYIGSDNVGQDVLPVPILILLLMFLIFIFIMSVVYVYHWSQFNLGDKFIKNAIVLYFIGLILLSLPLLLFLI